MVIRACHKGCRGSPVAGGTKSGYLFWFVIRVVPHINAVKRSACIEGARMALARVKMNWAKMEATDVATRGPPRGQDSPEHYFEEVLEGARLIEAQCLKNTCSSDMYLDCKNNALDNKGYIYTFARKVL